MFACRPPSGCGAETRVLQDPGCLLQRWGNRCRAVGRAGDFGDLGETAAPPKGGYQVMLDRTKQERKQWLSEGGRHKVAYYTELNVCYLTVKFLVSC